MATADVGGMPGMCWSQVVLFLMWLMWPSNADVFMALVRWRGETMSSHKDMPHSASNSIATLQVHCSSFAMIAYLILPVVFSLTFSN